MNEGLNIYISHAVTVCIMITLSLTSTTIGISLLKVSNLLSSFSDGKGTPVAR